MVASTRVEPVRPRGALPRVDLTRVSSTGRPADRIAANMAKLCPTLAIGSSAAWARKMGGVEAETCSSMEKSAAKFGKPDRYRAVLVVSSGGRMDTTGYSRAAKSGVAGPVCPPRSAPGTAQRCNRPGRRRADRSWSSSRGAGFQSLPAIRLTTNIGDIAPLLTLFVRIRPRLNKAPRQTPSTRQSQPAGMVKITVAPPVGSLRAEILPP